MEVFSLTAHFASPLRFADFDRAGLRKGFATVGKDIRKIARSLISRKGISAPHAYPGRLTSDMRRSINYRVSRKGFSVAIQPYLSAQKIDSHRGFYPAFVVYGHRGPGTVTKAQRKNHSLKRSGRKVALPRRNFVVDAAQQYGEAHFLAVMQGVLQESIKPIGVD